MRRASVVALCACAAACASTGRTAALGISLGGEAHVFVTGDRFAARLYEALTHRPAARLRDSLRTRRLVAISPPLGRRGAIVLFPAGTAPAALALARFHAPGACGRAELVTELVYAFPAHAGSRRATPPSHAMVVALLDQRTDSAAALTAAPRLPGAAARELIRRVARAGERAAGGRRGKEADPLAPLALDPDRASDAGEVVPLPRENGARYAVGFRARFAGATGDTVLTTGVAAVDSAGGGARWIVRPQRAPLVGGMLRDGAGVRYSLRGTVGPLVLVHEIADVRPQDSRALAVRLDGRVVAAQPLALRCP